jgi:starch phosphorylase
MNIRVSKNALFDIQLKRIHEYKRQLLNILSVAWRYRQIKGMSDDERADVVPRVIIFAGKAAPGYHIAKLIIKLINMISKKVNDDPDVEDLLKVIFVPNYNVSLAEIIIPASDISQHISTAGTEASGTSNMKFVMNGGLLLGTVDGANIEIKEEIGDENLFMFGTLAADVEDQRRKIREGKGNWDARLLETIKLLRDGYFGTFPQIHQLLDSFVHNDHYLISTDWPSYIKAQEIVDKTFKDEDKWTKMSILSSVGMGKFSSDRSVKDYAENIWKIEPLARPGPLMVDTNLIPKDQESSVGRYVASVSPLDAFSPFSGGIAPERLSPANAMKIRSYSPSNSPFF